VKFLKFFHVLTLIVFTLIAVATALFVIDDLNFVNVLATVMSYMGKEIDTTVWLSRLALILPICLLAGVLLLIIEEIIYGKKVKKIKHERELRHHIRLSRKNKHLFSKEAPVETPVQNTTVVVIENEGKKKHKKEKLQKHAEEIAQSLVTPQKNEPKETSSQNNLDDFLRGLKK